ncbi:hypothetical protein RHGRI_016293 [Rhododendron griersonianum]|uniref:C2HC zinc finger plants domain-containing protein n=1 Tax=Rhododendron griersonianum TaxID=479676 RepID=A0AAV6JTN1_9ERIC|nr:hypothetical protein RHGRI_016293 [Rhododendron griersonianum]
MPDATMASTDADMMESDMVPQTPQELTSNSDQGGGGDDAVRDLLTMARQLIDQGKPSQSLQASPDSLRIYQGNAGYGWHMALKVYEKRGWLGDNWRQEVVMAMKTKGGDQAVFQTLNRARELYRNKLRSSAAADELASLFAECAIAEAVPLKSMESEQDMVGPSTESDAHGNSILAETGRKQIVLDAFSDGSSFVCLQCGGLVSNHRKDEHSAYWCGKI